MSVWETRSDSVLGRVHGFAGIVVEDATLQVSGCADVAAGSVGIAFDQLDVVHEGIVHWGDIEGKTGAGSPAPRLRRYAGLSVSRLGAKQKGGGRNRTGVHGFAVRVRDIQIKDLRCI